VLFLEHGHLRLDHAPPVYGLAGRSPAAEAAGRNPALDKSRA
jgi:hypothetical protein